MREDQVFEWILNYWPYVFTVVTSIGSLWAAIHAVLWKRDVRSALGWAGLIILSPGIGAVLYFLFGINRVRRKAMALRATREKFRLSLSAFAIAPEDLEDKFHPHGEALMQIGKAVSCVVNRPLLIGNHIDLLENGEEAFPAMLEAIRQAQHSITLVSYIFSYDSLGKAFVDELALAVERGVSVRVLIDAVGVRYHNPSVYRVLKRRGVPAALFIPIHHISVFNLRTHRKICVVDGVIGFTGGMNIRVNHVLSAPSPLPTADVHFRLEGPIVGQLQEVFAEDWLFSTGESLQGERWFRPLLTCGDVICRGIADGPDETSHALAWALQAAISSAKKRVRIVTPYFIPDMALAMALGVASTRGIEVDIIIPSRSNLKLVQWASVAQIWQVVSFGCRVWLTPPPFDHAKLMTVDGRWSLIGSTNWDARSLRLNFEFNCEAYDTEFTAKLDALIESRLSQARRLNLDELQARPLGVRVRDGLARLVSPYL
ncbi:MAG TPA: phospholipase D-like domain-containing protein [Oligoflexus sp.]|uniref:phospholipase D-like domain-containing protein n=1 Tax=Oligoflexus sp. TaxID=1971216 RepID=UPI002D24769E|nr:phospholipase D-like domain-containing protein [Oligoflexus sp.]HYX38637.1 phospholipase D-like domain-containing protein [Oligoflexus sp.]